jgi:DNA mismatch endonuclease (patch repair protein)
MGYRFRLHVPSLPGRPDIVLRRLRLVIFVHGCFWHQHIGCNLAYRPKTNTAFWRKKFRANVDRDRSVADDLRRLGWAVHVIWECETVPSEQGVRRLERQLRSIIARTSRQARHDLLRGD